MAKFWREPLVQFAVLGAALFAANALWERAVSKSEYTISISAEELERQALIFAGENRREPTDEDVRALLFSYVEEQALMREAQRLGLGDDDIIIRRRLAQKMRFMIEDVDSPALPEEPVLKEWYENNKAQFIKAERRAFSHIYFSPDVRAEAVEENAIEALAGVTAENWQSLGDPFMMKREYGLLDQAGVERVFGTAFAKSLFSLERTNWQGPVSSAFGLHLIRVDRTEARQVPPYESVRDNVVSVWSEETRRTQNTQRLKDLIGKYKVGVEGLE